MARQSAAEFIAWLWQQRDAIVKRAQSQAGNIDDGYDIAMDALEEMARRAGNGGRPPNRGDALTKLHARVSDLCIEYRQARMSLTAKRHARFNNKLEHPTLRRGVGRFAELAASEVASDASVWDALRVPYTTPFTRVGPGPCNLCGELVWWTELNWHAPKGGARWMRKWEIIGAHDFGAAVRRYDRLRPSDQRHICGRKDAARKPRCLPLLVSRVSSARSGDGACPIDAEK